MSNTKRQSPHLLSYVESTGKVTWKWKGNTGGVEREWLKAGEKMKSNRRDKYAETCANMKI